MSLKETISSLLTVREESNRKAVTLTLHEDALAKVDRIAKEFTRVNESKSFSRNSIIEVAVNSFIEESENILLDNYGIDINDIEEEVTPETYDLLILPAHNDGFEEAFLGERRWYAFRIKEDRIPHIKYIACYRAAPISGITHYAEIKKITQYENTNKKIAYFKGEAIELDQTIRLGDSNASAFRSPRYTTLEKLKQAAVVSELF